MASIAAIPAVAANAPSPYGPVPSKRQLLWHELELYGILHFSVNTFTDKEKGYGDESPSVFHPTAFDADAIVDALHAAGMTAVMLTCKHHDGFCVWPTRTTEFSIRNSSWKSGKGDIVRDLSEAARRRGMKFGVYVSPWDRNSAAYGSPAYVKIYRDQLRELLTEYGPIYEVWHDGANGNSGYYGGAREVRKVDARTYYDWPRTWDMIRSLQPDAVIFSDAGPDIRWVGNEKGFANETCWATYDPVGPEGGPAAPGYVRFEDGTTGHRQGSKWMPAECDVSIRPGWFWHESENAKVKSPRELMDLYYRSVGRGASMFLNVPPDRRGLLHEIDVASLRHFGAGLRATFQTNLAAEGVTTASNIRQGFGLRNLVDGNRATYWTTDDAVKQPEVVVTWKRETAFNVVRIREHLPLGQRVDSFALDCWKNGDWAPLAQATSIGSARIIRTAEEVKTTRVRLRITRSAACPALSEFGIYKESLDHVAA